MFGAPIVAVCYAAEVLETTEHPLNDVATFVSGLIVAMRVLAGPCSKRL